MVRLQPHRQSAGQPDGVAEPGGDPALRRHRHQVLQPHDLADRGDDFGRQAGAQRGQVFRRRGEQVLAEVPDGLGGDRGECGSIVRIQDQPRDLVGFVGDQRIGQNRGQGRVGERHLRRHPLGGGIGGQSGERIARAERRRPRQQRAQVGEDVACAADAVRPGDDRDPHAACTRCRATAAGRARSRPGQPPAAPADQVARRHPNIIAGLAPLARRRDGGGRQRICLFSS